MLSSILLALLVTVPDPPAPPPPGAASQPASAPATILGTKMEPPKLPTARFPVRGGDVYVVGIPLQLNGRKNYSGLIDALAVALAEAVIEREKEDAEFRAFKDAQAKAAAPPEKFKDTKKGGGKK